MTAFNAGDLVKLKSGGPRMTVEQVGQNAMTGENSVWCVWFETVGNRQTVKREVFLPLVLEKTQKLAV
ncbi:YodC family protein [Pseudomonas sp. AN-1]|uniref:YodC family protein n=1 Tax=Pseudomonas sp. AN-1 TaxID=3096605 RepID=UPI002A6AF84D|nr:DUF2158 domain-containing protein [Pseudomonas sp. AN-1]WPP45743.1 DUF2158 domain-containing protein [Pseudomonas sp. AN-1]